MKAKDVRELTDDELGDRIRQAGEELFGLRMQKATARLEKPSRLRELRRDVARINTIRSERKRGGA
ncbi:MAG: 50S ribosomal protein L29 [Kiritimatiellia bacterium]|nr:50S ribosomal protein L29 [Kiritimatiellia bacterium]